MSNVVQKQPTQRTAIFHRTPCCSQLECVSCRLCNQTEDCDGNRFVDVFSDEPSSVIRKLYIKDSLVDWDSVMAQITTESNSGSPMRLITDRKIPQRVLWKFSYSDKNVIQINLDMTKFPSNISWVEQIMITANKCGIYVVLCMYPIVPQVIKTYQVLEIIDRFKWCGHFTASIKFCEIPDTAIVSGGWLNFNGVPVSIKYLVHSNSVWKCTEEFKDLYMKYIYRFSIPRKIKVNVCKDSK